MESNRCSKITEIAIPGNIDPSKNPSQQANSCSFLWYFTDSDIFVNIARVVVNFKFATSLISRKITHRTSKSRPVL
jgi:hypothetical protein